MDALELLASAVAGRHVALQRSGASTWTDGTTIFVTGDPTGLERWSVVCQAALLFAGSLDGGLMRRLARMPTTSAQRYLGLEVVRAAGALDTLLPGSFRRALATYDARVPHTGSAEESLALAHSDPSVPVAPAWFGELRPRQVTRADRRAGAPAGTRDIDEALKKLAAGQDADEVDGGDGGDRSRLAELLSSPLRNPLGSALMKMLGARSAPGTTSGGGGEVGSVSFHAGDGSGRAVPRQAAPLVDMGGQLVHGHGYPEWDTRRNRYREGWCTVGEFDPPVPALVPELRASPDAGLVRALARLGLTYRPHAGEPSGDELDLGALVEHRVRVAAGFADLPRVFRAERRTQQELGALVLLDATGSTADRTGATSVFEAQRQLALDLTTTLDRLGVRVATYAFYSRGRNNVRFLRCKSFDERWSIAAQRRLAAITPGGFTRLGAAVRHATHLLDAQAGTQRRLLLVVGDGIPYDDGYEGRYAVEDCRRAVDEAGVRAVACVGLSAVAPQHQDSLWSTEAHAVVPDSSALAREAPDLLGAALIRASRRSTIPRHLQELPCR